MKSEDDLKKMSVKDLRAIASAIGIDAAAMKKGEVLEALLSAGTPEQGTQPADTAPSDASVSGAAPAPEGEKKKRGRPKGSVNKKKIAVAEEISSEASEPEKPKVRRGRRPQGVVNIPPVSAATPAPAQEEQKPADTPRDTSKRATIPAFRPTYRTPQKAEQAFSRDFTQGYDRKPGYGQYGSQQFTDKRMTPAQQRMAQQRPFDQRSQIDRRYLLDREYVASQRMMAEKQRPSEQFVRREVEFPKTLLERQMELNDEFPPRPSFREIPKDESARALERDEFPPENVETEVREPAPRPEEEKEFDCYGILEINQNGYGFLRAETLYPGAKDIFVAPPLIRRHQLRTGDMITGKARAQSKEFNAQFALTCVLEINGIISENVGQRPTFESLTPTYPDEQLVLETTRDEYATRIIDLFSPIGKGQRGLIVSPPKAGKTVLLKTIANALIRNYPDVHLIMLLIDERPEEVTDIKESVQAMVVASTFDEMTSRHIAVSEFCLEHAERLVEMGEDVVILMDSITRLARAYNQEVTPSGRSLSGGLDPAALYKPKKFFGAARNIKGGGSLTIIATALVDTGSRLDDVIYEEFKGTGNMELHLDRSLAERRIFPSIDITLSGTRKEELLLPRNALDKIYALRRSFSNVNNAKDITEAVINNIAKTEDNKHFLNGLKITSYTS